MKRQTILMAILALLTPILLRGIWHYRGFPEPRLEIATPNYAAYSRPTVEVNEPDLTNIKPLDGKVLLDGYHGNQFILSEIEPLSAAIRARGGIIELTTDMIAFETGLKTATAFVSISPSIIFTEYETRLLKDFTARGGKIIVFTDATRFILGMDYISGNPIAMGDAIAANSLLAHFDITIQNDYLYNTQENEGNFRNILFQEFGKSDLAFGLDTVALYGVRSVSSSTGTILLPNAKETRSSINDAHEPNTGGAALSADESTAAFGDLTFLSPPYSTYTDNATLIQNIADFLLSGQQTPNLKLFPYIFSNNTAQVFIAPEVEKDASMVAALGSLQSSLQYINLEVTFADTLPAAGNTIILGTFDSTDLFEDTLMKTDVSIDETYINTAAFGEIMRSGNGLILFESNKRNNTLTLLANTPEDLIVLLSTIGYGDLSSCLKSDQVAICSVGSSDYYYEDFSTETTDPTLETTPSPEG